MISSRRVFMPCRLYLIYKPRDHAVENAGQHQQHDHKRKNTNLFAQCPSPFLHKLFKNQPSRTHTTLGVSPLPYWPRVPTTIMLLNTAGVDSIREPMSSS